MTAKARAFDELRFSWTEISGSLGDLGLFLPLVVAMSIQNGLDMGGILIAAGLMNIATGLLFRQPIPVQPMKAIAAVAITEGLLQGELVAAGLIMGASLVVVSLTGAVDAITRLVPAPLVRGIQLGVGLKLAAKGANWVVDLPFFGWDSVVIALLAALLLLLCVSKEFPGLLFIFFGGFVLLWMEDVTAYENIAFGLPTIAFDWPAAPEWKVGLLRGAVPQLPLTMLNSVIAVCALSSDYFPERGISTRRMALSVGLMNLLCVPFSGMPMCHGAGGLAAQYRFGARTGGSVIMLGGVKLAAGLLLGAALIGILKDYPMSILGPMLIFAGVELARSCADAMTHKRSKAVVLLTAACILGSNTFIGFLVGAALYACLWLGMPSARLNLR
jgi:MFS superfamily sulfate permease-like transporter